MIVDIFRLAPTDLVRMAANPFKTKVSGKGHRLRQRKTVTTGHKHDLVEDDNSSGRSSVYARLDEIALGEW